MPNLKMACDFQSHSQFPRIARISCKFFERKSLEIFSIKWNRAADLCAPPPNCGSWVNVLLNSSLHAHIGEEMEGESKNIRCWVGFFPKYIVVSSLFTWSWLPRLDDLHCEDLPLASRMLWKRQLSSPSSSSPSSWWWSSWYYHRSLQNHHYLRMH